MDDMLKPLVESIKGTDAIIVIMVLLIIIVAKIPKVKLDDAMKSLILTEDD